MAESLEAEVERLRSEVQQWRQREVDQLRAALVAMTDERDSYRRDCDRLEKTGRQIAADYERRLTEYRTKLAIYQNVDVSVRRNQPIRGGVG